MRGYDVNAMTAADGSSVLSVSEMIELERKIAEGGTSLHSLMTKAGTCVSAAVKRRFEPPTPVAVLCGSGNNGGDGWVAAQDLAASGYPTTLITPIPSEDLRAEPAREAALEACAQARKDGSPLSIIVSPDIAETTRLLSQADVIIDAMLGIGFDGAEVKEPYSLWIDCANDRRAHADRIFVLAVDVPSGLSAQTGGRAASCIIADATITMIAYKPGLLEDKAKPYCGMLELAKIAPGQMP